MSDAFFERQNRFSSHPLRPLTTITSHPRMHSQVDTDSNGWLSRDTVQGLLSYIAMEAPSEETDMVFDAYDMDKNGVITQAEFLCMCTELLWNYPIPLLTMAAANFVAASSNTYERNKYYWEKVPTSPPHYSPSLAAHRASLLVPLEQCPCSRF